MSAQLSPLCLVVSEPHRGARWRRIAALVTGRSAAAALPADHATAVGAAWRVQAQPHASVCAPQGGGQPLTSRGMTLRTEPLHSAPAKDAAPHGDLVGGPVGSVFGDPFGELGPQTDAQGRPRAGLTVAPDSAPDSAVTYWHLREADGPQVLVLSPAQRQTVQVVHGRLWLTAEGRADDQVLQAGQAVMLCGPGRLRLGALVLASDGPRGARRAGQGRGPTPDGAFAEPGACVLRLTPDVP